MKQFQRSGVLHSWASLLAATLDALTLISLLLTISVIYFTAFVSNKDPLLVMLLSILSAVMAAITGSRINQAWLAASVIGQLSAKGNASIKSLKVLTHSIMALENRTRQFMTLREKDKSIDLLLQHQLSEIRGRCMELKRQTIKIIADWDDVVPEANLVVQTSTLAHLSQKIALLEEDKKSIEQEVEHNRGKEDRTRKLGGEIHRRDDEIMALRKLLNDKQLAFNCSVLGGLSDVAGAAKDPAYLFIEGEELAEPATNQSFERYTKHIEEIEVVSAQSKFN